MAKRKADTPIFDRKEFIKQYKQAIEAQQSHILTFQRTSSKLLVPQVPLTPEDLRTIFSIRSYRTLTTSHKSPIMELNESEAIVALNQLMERYKKQTNTDLSPLIRRVPQKVRKRENFMIATRYLLESNLSLPKIALNSGLKKKEVRQLQKRLNRTGDIFPIETRRPKLLLYDHLQFLSSTLNVQRNGVPTLAKLRRDLFERFEELTTISLPTISKALHFHGFSYKKITPYEQNRNFPKTKLERINAGTKLISALSTNMKVIFIDETSIRLGCGPNYGWGFKGERLSQKNTTDKQSFTAMVAITDVEVLGCILLQGGMTQDDYCGFICTLIQSIDSLKEANSIVVFADNAAPHRADFVQKILGDHVTFLNNAPYSPMMNPIEEFFSKFKHMIKKQTCNTERQITCAVQDALDSFVPEDFNGYIRDTLRYILRSFDDQDL